MASAPLNWLLKIGGDALTTVAQTISGAINELKSGKADKVANATSGNLAALDANGNIVDSGTVAPSGGAMAIDGSNAADYVNLHNLQVGNSTNQYSGIIGTLQLGDECYVYEDNSVAAGDHAVVNSINSFAIGSSVRTEYPNQFVTGYWNNPQPNNLFEVGNGTANNARSNAFAVTAGGDASVKKDLSVGENISAYDITANHDIGALHITGGKFSSNAYSSFMCNRFVKLINLSSTASTTVTFTDSSINDDSIISVYIDRDGVNPTSVRQTGSNTIAVVFPPVSSGIAGSARVILEMNGYYTDAQLL